MPFAIQENQQQEVIKKNMRCILILIVLLFGKCNSQATSDEMTEGNFENKIFLSILKNQLKTGAMGEMYETDYPIYEYSLNDLSAIEEIIGKELGKKGYIKPTEEDFSSKINNIFGRIINYTSDKDFLLINFSDKCSKELMFLRNEDSGLYSTYIFKRGLFISDLYSIPEVFDYSKYPQFVKLEDSVIQNRKDKDLKIYYWKDVVNSKQRKENIDKLVHRNKFLFNNDRSSFHWLSLNDEVFLTSLVLTFGYVEDKELDKYVLEKQLKGVISEFGRVFWHQRCDGKLFFHNEMIDIIRESSIEKQKEYLNAISLYIRFLVNDKKLPFGQKAEILGKLCYYAEKIGKPIDMGFKYFYILETESSGDIYEEEFKKKEYYNIPDFKKVWEYTRTIIPHSKNNDIIFSKKVDINKDGIEDGIIVYNPENDLFATIKIVLSDKDREKLFFNTKMLSNNITTEEGFRNISFKGHFFTIEENVSSDLLQYTTFFVDSKTNNIFLYKLEFSNISDNGYDDEYYDSIYIQKKNGKVSFENYDPKMLRLF